MKNIMFVFIIIVLTSLTINICHSNEYNPKRPEWVDFCPRGFENAELDSNFYWLSVSRYKKDAMNYWTQRRYDFEKMVNDCDHVPTESRDACYAKVESRQKNITEQYNNEQLAISSRRQEAINALLGTTKNPNEYKVNVNHSGSVNSTPSINQNIIYTAPSYRLNPNAIPSLTNF